MLAFRLRPASRLLAAFAALATSALRADLGFTSLGGLPGGTGTSLAWAISADGLTVVGHASSSASSEEAFIWTAATGMSGLGDLPGGSAFSRATAVSADGTVVVGNGSVDSGFQQGFRWTQAGGLVAIGDLPGGLEYSTATGVSADGAVVVGFGINAANRNEPLRWTSATGPVGIGFFLDGAASGNSGTAYGISADGSVIVGKGTLPTGHTRAFRHTTATGLVNLGVYPDGDSSTAFATSADGSVVVGTAYLPGGDGSREAFRWTAATGLVRLGDFPGGAVLSEALAVSADGSVIVGTADSGNFSDGAFVWDAVNGLRSIRALLNLAGLAPGWGILAATGVSADGRRIVGYGYGPNGNEAWLLDFDAAPPPPPPPPPAATAGLVWTEDLPQTEALKANSVVRIAYANGTGITDIATLTGGSNGGWGGAEYRDGLLLIPSLATAGTGTRTHAARYAPILVTNLFAYDLDYSTGYLWRANGGSRQLFKAVPSGLLTVGANGVLDRTYTNILTRNTGRFTNALQHDAGFVTFSSSVTNPIGLYKRDSILQDQVAVFTESGAAAAAIYDFEIVGSYIYFGDITNNAIKRVNTDGTGLVTLVANALFPNSIDVTADAIYWTELNTKLIRRAALDGSSPATVLTLANSPRGVVAVPLSLIDGPAPQAISVAGIDAYYYGRVDSSVTLTATATSGLPVTLAVLSGPATISGSTLTYTGSGTVIVRATQAGDASHAPSTLDLPVEVTALLGQTITFPALPDVIYTGTPPVVTLAATASSALTVSFSITGGADIATLDPATGVVTLTGPGSVTIQAAQYGDHLYWPADVVEHTFTVAETLGGNPFLTYLSTSGVSAEQRGALDDPDADGIANLLEYALGLAPANPNSDALPAAVAEDGFLNFTYNRAAPISVTYTVETTTDLADPESWTSVGVAQGTPAGDGLTTASVPLDGPRRFLRLRVTLVP